MSLRLFWSVVFLSSALVGQREVAVRRALDAASKKLLTKVMERPPLDALRDLGAGKADDTRTAWRGKGVAAAIHRAVERAALAGLWSDDRMVARGAASLLTEWMLDVDEIARYQQVMQEVLFGPEDADLSGRLIDYDFFKHTVSQDDLDRALRRSPPWGSDYRYFWLRDLHRSLTPRVLPQLCKLTQHDDPQTRKQAMSSICTVTAQSNQHRELVARAMLAWAGPIPGKILGNEDQRANQPAVPRKFELPEVAGEGLPVLLAAVLRRSLDARFGAQAEWPTWFQVRWAADSTAGPRDAQLLWQLLRSKRAYLRFVAIRGLGQLRDATSGQRLWKHCRATKDELEHAMALGALVRRGDRKARTRLTRLAMENGTMLAAALEAMPRVVIAQWADRAFHRDPEIGMPAVKRMDRAEQDLRMGPLVVQPFVREEIAATIERFADRTEFARLHVLLDAFDECRTRTFAKSYLAALRPEFLEIADLAFLEVADEVALRRRLLEWCENKETHALAALARLGAPKLGQRLVEHFAKSKQPDLVVLARSASSPVVKAYLAAALRALRIPAAAKKLEYEFFAPVAAQAMANGYAEPAARELQSRLHGLPLSVLRERFAAWQAALLAGETTSVLLAVLRTRPIVAVAARGLGHIREPQVVAFLHRVRLAPGANVQDAIGALAAIGDPVGRREMRRVMERRYYGWADDATRQALTLGFDLATIPYWIEEVETNCCRRVAANQAIEGITRYDIFDYGDRSLLTQADGARRWWRRFRSQLKWSRLARRYVVAPK